MENSESSAESFALASVPTISAAAITVSACPDALAMLLADKRSPETRRAYRSDLSAFFSFLGATPSPEEAQVFLRQAASEIALSLASYKAAMVERGLSEATVNRRLAAIRSLLKMSHRLGLSQTDGRGLVDGEKSHAYRDTRGVDVAAMRRLIALPLQNGGVATVQGLRDSALLRLLCENALRRAEVCALDLSDFRDDNSTLYIIGKGRGTQKQPVTLSPKLTAAITRYLEATQRSASEDGPLFRNLDHRPGKSGGRLTPDGLFWLVQNYGKKFGLVLTPHRLRHSAITAALELTGGDVRRVQKLSRHADLRTLMVYDDNRADFQGEVTGLLSGVL